MKNLVLNFQLLATYTKNFMNYTKILSTLQKKNVSCL
ncbi:hypothetical protein FWK35_00021806, partial [Aphis craccivora]